MLVPANPVDATTLAVNLALAADLRVLVDALDAAGIDVVVLKGIPLTMRLFGSLGARSMIDNDLLVRRGDAERAATVLGSRGYESIDDRKLANQLALDYEFRMRRPLPGGGFLYAELHWTPFSQLLYPVNEEQVWSRVEPYSWDGRTLRVFDRPLTLVHLAAHFMQSDFAIPQVLRDVATAWNRWFADTTAQPAIDLARELGLVHALDFALRSAADLGMLETSAPAIGSRRADRVRRLLPAEKLWTPRPVPDYERWFLALLLANPRRVPRWLWYAMFPPLENLAAIEGAPVSSALRWRYLLRPFRAFARGVDRRRPRIVRQ
jgi:hypothetical protein